MVHKSWIVGLLLMLLAALAFAQDDLGSGGATTTPDPTPVAQTINDALKKVNVPAAVYSADPNGPPWTHVRAHSLTKDGLTYTKIEGATIDANGNILYVDQITLPNGVTLIGATNPTATGGNSYQVDQVQTLQQGPIVITNGQNVVYDNGCIRADSADSLVHIDTVATQLNTLTYCGAELQIEHADSVWAGCVYMEDVEDSTITASTQISIQSQSNSNFSIRDCASNEVQFAATSDDASLTISKETVSPTYVLDDVSLTIEKPNLTEFVQSNCTATVEVHRQNGVEKMSMCPVSMYTYDTKDPLKDFTFRAWQDFHTIFLKKSMSAQFLADAPACKDCSLVDLANHRIEVRGVVDFKKNQLDRMGKNLNSGPVPFFTTANKNARATLLLDNDNAIVNEILIQADAPPYRTYVSNYLTISESIQTNNKTERLLDINEKITKETISHSLVKSYRTAYSNASLLIDNNELKYQREGTNVVVLPDGHATIKTITDKVKDKRAFLLLPLLGLLAIPLRKRGQLSMFILLGVFMLIIVGIMFYVVGIASLPNGKIQVTERQHVQDYVTQCLAIAGKNAVDVFGVQGGYIALQTPHFPAPPTAYLYERGKNNVLPIEVAQNAIASETASRLSICIDDFKGLSGVNVEVTRAPDVKTFLALRDTTFQMSYPFSVRRGDERWDFDEFGITIDVPVLQHYLAANATVHSQVLNDGEINLDVLPATKMTFFPLQQTLMAFIESVSGKMLEPYYFFFANQRP